ncbi:M91 family zinc metallopeptidase [Streptomyces murinus]|uniref:M91 family zinc metallopeptidase n=1 Tax=Streptomyces murinus TaxID=33900 RepID=UPI003F46E814
MDFWREDGTKLPQKGATVKISIENKKPFDAISLGGGIAVSTATDSQIANGEQVDVKASDEFISEIDDYITRICHSESGKKLVGFFESRPIPRRLPRRLGDFNNFSEEVGSEWLHAKVNNDLVGINLVIYKRNGKHQSNVSSPTSLVRAMNGSGSPSLIRYDPQFTFIQDRVIVAPELILAHEMIHSAHSLAGCFASRESGDTPILCSKLKDKFAFDETNLEEMATHGSQVGLRWILGTLGSDEKEKLRMYPSQIASIEVASAFEKFSKISDARITKSRCDIFEVSELRIALELGLVTRPSYGAICGTPQQADQFILELDKKRGEISDSVFNKLQPASLNRRKVQEYGLSSGTRSILNRPSDEPRITQHLTRGEEQRATSIINASTNPNKDNLLGFTQAPLNRPGDAQIVNVFILDSSVPS